MSLTPEEAEELALLEAEEADARQRANVSRQNAARTSVEAEQILEGPTTKEKVAAASLAAADAVSPGTSNAHLGVAATMFPAALPITTTYRALRELAGTDKALEEAAEIAPSAFGYGQLGGQLLSLVGGGKSAKTTAPGVVKAAKSAGPGLAARGKAALREVGREVLESGGEAKWRGNVARALRTLVGEGGEATDNMVVGADKIDDVRPEWFAPLTDDTANAAGKMEPSGLDIVKRPPPVPKAKPRAPRKPASEPATPEADVRVEAAKLLEQEAAPASKVVPPSLQGPNANKVPLYPHAEPGDPGYGVMVTLDEYDALLQAGKVRPIPPPHTPTPQELAASMPKATPTIRSDAELKELVREGAKNGVPLKELARQLGVTQDDIRTWWRAARDGF